MRLLLLTQTVDRKDPVLGFFHRWLLEFSRRFEAVTVVCLREGEHDLPSNVRVLSLGKEARRGRFVALVRFYSYVLRLRKEYDAVFVHMNPEYVVFGGLLWKIFRKKTALWYAHRSVTMKLRVAAIFADILFTPSVESLRIKNKKIRIMGHGIDIEEFSPRTIDDSKGSLSRRGFSVLTVGRISPSKGYETLLRALATLTRSAVARQVGGVTLSIVGAPATVADGAYEKKIRGLSQELGVAEVVSFKGGAEHGNLPAIIREADAFVNMSSTGSMDKAILEAMSCGIPSVTSNEAFQAILGSHGLIFRPGDSSELASLLEGLANRTREERRTLGEKLRAVVVTEHSLTRLVTNIASTYEEKKRAK